MTGSRAATCSVITICSGRERHLGNLVAGLSCSAVLPEELVIVRMNGDPVTEYDAPFPIVQIGCGQPGNPLSLSKGRNVGAEKAGGSTLVFLDVDCIPSADLLGNFRNAVAHSDILWMGQVRYLRDVLDGSDLSPGHLDSASDPNGKQPIVPDGGVLSGSAHELFWSLNFALTAGCFSEIGGFDESYTGYGGEDTDFSFNARSLGIPLGHAGAKAWHQFHESVNPPVNHLEDIVGNARVFKAKWAEWPMTGWLEAFEERGLIRFADDRSEIKIVSNHG